MVASGERRPFGEVVGERRLNGQPTHFHLDLFVLYGGRLRVPGYLVVRAVPVHDAGVQRYFPVLQPFLQGHVQRLAVLHLDGGALLVGQERPDGARERRGRLVAPGLAVLPGMVHLFEQFLFLGLELVQLDGQLAVLGQVYGRRMVERGERAVERVYVALGQTHHLPDVLQLVAQRRDLLEIERHGSGGLRRGAPDVWATGRVLQAVHHRTLGVDQVSRGRGRDAIVRVLRFTDGSRYGGGGDGPKMLAPRSARVLRHVFKWHRSKQWRR